MDAIKQSLLSFFKRRLGDALSLPRLFEFGIVLDWLEPKRGEKICDIACGGGELSLKLARKGCEVYGIDFSRDFIKSAGGSKKKRDVRCEFVVGDAECLPFRSGFFDKVVSNCSLEHFHNDTRALQEMRRVLKPNGILVLTVDSLSYPNIKMDTIRMHRSVASVVNYYSRESLGEKLEKAGFEIVSGKYYLASPLSIFLWEWGVKSKYGSWWKILSGISYPLCLFSDRLYAGKAQGGCGLL